MDIKYILFNIIIKELPVMLEEIKFKTKFDKFINQTKKFINQKVKTNDIFSMCYGILMYGEWVIIPTVLTKKILKDFHTGQITI